MGIFSRIKKEWLKFRPTCGQIHYKSSLFIFPRAICYDTCKHSRWFYSRCWKQEPFCSIHISAILAMLTHVLFVNYVVYKTRKAIFCKKLERKYRHTHRRIRQRVSLVCWWHIIDCSFFFFTCLVFFTLKKSVNSCYWFDLWNYLMSYIVNLSNTRLWYGPSFSLCTPITCLLSMTSQKAPSRISVYTAHLWDMTRVRHKTRNSANYEARTAV